MHNVLAFRYLSGFWLVLYLEHSPLYRHFCKCLHIELLKYRLLFNYWMLKKSLQPLIFLDKVFTLKNSNKLDSVRLIRLLTPISFCMLFMAIITP